MLGSLRERLAGLGESMSSALGEEEGGSPEEPLGGDQMAGAKLLSHFQAGWRRLHEGAEQTAKQADRTDKEVSALYGEYDKQWKQVAQLSGLLGQLPTMNEEVEGIMKNLAQLEALCQEVELALLALEDTIDAREAQERQLETRFQLALEQERRRQELEELEQRLEQSYQKRLRDKREEQEHVRRERQHRIQAQFEADMATFRTGTGLPNRLEVPRPRRQEVSLESVDLDEVGEEAQRLEEFLNSDVPDVEPLPCDEESPKQSQST